MNDNMKWTSSMTCTFVELYAKHECLWNVSSPGHKIYSEREKAYTSMAEEFFEETEKYLSKFEVKDKIKNLRSTYMQQLKMILARSTSTITYVPRLPWFDTMHKMLQVTKVRIRRSSTNSEEQLIDLPSSSKIEWNEDSDSFKNPDESANYNNSCNEEDAKTNNENEKQDRKAPVRRRFKFKRVNVQSPKMKNVSALLSNNIDDEFDIYGKYVASQLRKLKLANALRVQLTIQNIISEARILEDEDDQVIA